jgi:hypothetical protein
MKTKQLKPVTKWRIFKRFCWVIWRDVFGHYWDEAKQSVYAENQDEYVRRRIHDNLDEIYRVNDDEDDVDLREFIKGGENNGNHSG